MFPLGSLFAASLVLHAAFDAQTSRIIYKRYFPPVVAKDGVVDIAAVKRLQLIDKVLRQPTSFMILGNDGEGVNVFFCTKHDKANQTVHQVDACLVYEENEGDAVDALMQWYAKRLPGIELTLA